ncbi:ABC transporter permease subunit [Lentzea flava]|uniref:ABC transporter permease subunit n=1 Tax=Lentzea flava TaxID=103732 RepID=UPI0016709764|nr:ABC transporter permease subunit [Lentzea flava]MCP2204907.1 ABC-type dipeptide/oligopeptide/nickel transport system, permease component [Lentzea flava]
MRVLGRLCALLGLTAVIGLLPLVAGRDPALAVLRARSADREPDAEAIASVRRELGLDAGPFELLGRWSGRALHGDLGTSWVSGEPVSAQLGSAIGVSSTLTGLAAVVAVLVMTALVARPFAAGLRGKSPSSRAGVAAVLAALPEFLIGSVLLLVISVRLGWLPTSGWRDLSYAVLPAIALGTPAGAVLAVVAGDALRDALTAPWLRSWTAAGFPARTIALAVVRRAGSVVTGQLGLVVAGMFGSAATVEVVFGVPGLGRLAVDAALAQDVPVVQACVLVILLGGAAAGALGAVAQRLLLGPALVDGALESAAPRPVTPGRWSLILPAGAVIAVVLWGIWRDPFTVDLSARLLPPSAAHPMGTDALGRDLLARVAHGALHTGALATGVTALVVVIALGVGIAGRRGSGAADLVNALPTVVVALAVAATAGPGWTSAVIAVAAVAWAPPAAHARSLALEQRGSAHLTAARALGASTRHILVRHVLPAVLPPVLRNAFVRLPAVALALASLGYLGLGAQPPEPEWGLLLAEGMPNVERAPWVVAFPAAALVLLGVGAVVAASRVR